MYVNWSYGRLRTERTKAGMSFRRERDEWDEFLRVHGSELHALGIPDDVTSDKKRFLVFLDHGYDEWGWFKDREGFFDSRQLTDDQITRLADVIATHIDPRMKVRILSRWTRWE